MESKYIINLTRDSDSDAITMITDWLVHNPELWEDGIYLHVAHEEDEQTGDDIIRLVFGYYEADRIYHIDDDDINQKIKDYAYDMDKEPSDVAAYWINQHIEELWNPYSDWLIEKAETFFEWIKDDFYNPPQDSDDDDDLEISPDGEDDE